MSFEIDTECACCGKAMQFTLNSHLSYTLQDQSSSPMFYAPLVDFTKLKAPSIVDVF